MEALLIMFLLVCLGVFALVLANVSKPDVKPFRCSIHKWERTNGVLLCSECGWSPEIEKLIDEMKNKRQGWD